MVMITGDAEPVYVVISYHHFSSPLLITINHHYLSPH